MKSAPAPKSVRLTTEESERMKKIAEALGVTEHAAMHLAIRHFLAAWAKGWRPKKTKKTVTTYEP
jgi:predicted transcriptional regulator